MLPFLFWFSIRDERNCGSIRWQLDSCYLDNEESNKSARECFGFEIKHTQFHRCSSLLFKKSIHLFCQTHPNYSCDLLSLWKLSHDNKQEVYLGEWEWWGTERWRLFNCAPSSSKGLVLLFVAAPHRVHTRWHLFRNPCSYTWKASALFFWNREINKCPSDCFRIKKKTPRTHDTRCVCTCACIIDVGTICCTLSPHSHLFIWRESTNIIWIPIRLTLGVHTLHHHGASTVHCNLNPLFESCVCKRDGRMAAAGREIKTDSFQWSYRGNMQSGVKIMGLWYQQGIDRRVN